MPAALAASLVAAAASFGRWAEKDGMDGRQLLPDLSGAWTDGAEHFFLSRSQDPRGPAVKPNSTYTLLHLTGGAAAECVVDSTALYEDILRSGAAVTCSLPAGEVAGRVGPAAASIAVGGWNMTRANGRAAGLWHASRTEYYILSHHDGELAVWGRRGGSWRRVPAAVAAAAVEVEVDGARSAGTVSGDEIVWRGGAKWLRHPSSTLPNDVPIHTVHMVFMNHYDVGYTSFINDVDNQYTHQYYPLAAKTAEEMRAAGSNDSFIYVTHPWLMRRYLDCPCPPPPQNPAQLEGVWTGSPLGGESHRYFMSPINETAAGVRCLTSQWEGGKAGGCGWGTGVCVRDAKTAAVTCALDNGATIEGPLVSNGTEIAFKLPWRKFAGELSGLWYGPKDVQDYYVMAHNQTDGGVTVWWDTGLTKAGWRYGAGAASATSVSLTIPDYSKKPINGTYGSYRIEWGGSAGSWNRHPSQCYPKDTECKDASVCPARSLNNDLTAPLTCPSADEVKTFTDAAKRGDISWHAQAFNLESENMSPELYDAGMGVFAEMDERFYGEQRTITASDRDVIYVTRSVIPFLARRNVTGLTIGSNGANYPPQVPKLHRWLDEGSGKDVIVAYHPYGYGGYGKSDCAESPDGVALCTEFRTDNTGPPASVKEVTDTLEVVRKEYPGAVVKTSTFDNFIRQVTPEKHNIPLITQEVGDTWMYGVPSDPLKMAQNRAAQRVWADCAKSGEARCQPTDPVIRNFTWALLKAPEHTWGIPGISGWGTGNDYDKALMHSKLNTSAYMKAAATWAEQRFFNELAVRALEEAQHPIAAAVRSEFDLLSNVQRPDLSGYAAADPAAVLPVKGFKFQFDTTGALIGLVDARGVAWASQTNQLAAVAYSTLNETEWKPFTYTYCNSHKEEGGFCKPGSNKYTESKAWRPALDKLWVSSALGSVVAQVSFPADAVAKYGAPSAAFVNFTVTGSGSVDVTLQWFGKQPVMIGESTSIAFTPAPALKPVGNGSAWRMDKLGQPVDPENVIAGGNQFNHGVWGGVTAATAGGLFKVHSLDAPNVNPATADFPFGNPLPASYVYDVAHSKKGGLQQLAPGSVRGMAVNLHNNLWNTNYPLYYPYYDPLLCPKGEPLSCRNANAVFRFRVTLG